jgi:hypothetical protein
MKWPVYKIRSCLTTCVVVRKTQLSVLHVNVLSSFVVVRVRGADMQIEPVIFLEKSPIITLFSLTVENKKYCLKTFELFVYFFHLWNLAAGKYVLIAA